MAGKTLIQYAVLGNSLLLIASCAQKPAEEVKKPNIIYIYTDQQHANMMSCAGNEYLKTPAMDYIAENGVRFTRAYTTNPVCAPARVSLMTGRFPGYFKDNKGNIARENGECMRIPEVSDEVKNTTIAAYLKQVGYDLVYGGKEHLPPSLTPMALGFNDITDDERGILALKAAEYIKKDHEKPYFMVVSLINPHDICYMAIRDFAKNPQSNGILRNGKIELATLDSALQKPQGLAEDQFMASFPPLPPNIEPQEDEPKAINALISQRPFRLAAREQYTEKDWRTHRYAYCRLTEFVDSEIQVILDALKESGDLENTLVLFSSDHGDNDAAHRLEHKTVLYEEAANIPFMAMWQGHIKGGRVDTEHLISNGLDLLPTVCDFAGIKGVADPRGMSLRPIIENKEVEWRNTLGVESQIGRMVVDAEGFKYIKYDAVGIEENLLNLNEDPYETTHFTSDSAYADKLNELKEAFQTVWFPGF